MNKEYDAAAQAEKLKSMIDGVLRTGDEQVREVELLQSLVDNAPVEAPEELRSIVADAADAIRDRNKKLKEYITNPKSKVSASDLDLSNTIDDLLERARNFVSRISSEDTSLPDEETLKNLNNTIEINEAQIASMRSLMCAVNKVGFKGIDDPEEFEKEITALIAAMENRNDVLKRCRELPVYEWPDIEDMAPRFTALMSMACPADIGSVLSSIYNDDDAHEEESEEEAEDKCRKIEASICNGKLSVTTEGFLPDEHGRIERFLAREFDFELEQDEQEADGIFAEADKKHLSRTRSPKDVIADMERELAKHMYDNESVMVPYIVDGTKYAADIPMGFALKFWDAPENVKAIQAVLRAVIDQHKAAKGYRLPPETINLDDEFTNCEGTYKLIYDMNK